MSVNSVASSTSHAAKPPVQHAVAKPAEAKPAEPAKAAPQTSHKVDIKA